MDTATLPDTPDTHPATPVAPDPAPAPNPAAVLQLDLHPQDAAALGRSRVLRAALDGRWRRATTQLVWRDAADDALAGAGLVLAADRHGWQLERLWPSDAPWAPATPEPALARGAASDLARAWTAAGLEPSPDVPVVAVAAFHGTRRNARLRHDSGMVELDVLDGMLRAVTAEEACARLRLSGPPQAVAALALALAGELRLSVPRASLAARARALARGLPVPPRRLGAPQVQPGMTVADAIAHVLGHLTDVALHFLDRVPGATDPEPVHQARVALRRLRSALSVFRRASGHPALRAAGDAARALAAQLGAARDWDVFLAETGTEVAAAFPGDPRITATLAAGERRRGQAYGALRAWMDTPERRGVEIGLACLSALRPWQPEPLAAPTPEPDLPLPDTATDLPPAASPPDAAIPGLLGQPCADYAAAELARRYRKVTRTGRHLAELSDEALHELRKDCKRLRYACEFFAPLFPGRPAKKFLRAMSPLQEALGHVNDGAAAAALMSGLGRGAAHAFAGGAVQGFVAGRAGRGRRRLRAAWDDFADAPQFWK